MVAAVAAAMATNTDSDSERESVDSYQEELCSPKTKATLQTMFSFLLIFIFILSLIFGLEVAFSVLSIILLVTCIVVPIACALYVALMEGNESRNSRTNSRTPSRGPPRNSARLYIYTPRDTLILEPSGHPNDSGRGNSYRVVRSTGPVESVLAESRYSAAPFWNIQNHVIPADQIATPANNNCNGNIISEMRVDIPDNPPSYEEVGRIEPPPSYSEIIKY